MRSTLAAAATDEVTLGTAKCIIGAGYRGSMSKFANADTKAGGGHLGFNAGRGPSRGTFPLFARWTTTTSHSPMSSDTPRSTRTTPARPSAMLEPGRMGSALDWIRTNDLSLRRRLLFR